jgi:ATP-dependent protease ClpP protease subunit
MHKALMLASAGTLELSIYGEIGENFLFGGGVGPKWVAEQLKANPDVKTIQLKISSPGGNAWDAMAIRSALAAHPARKEIDVEGLCASAATVIATVGDVVRMHAGSAFMIHGARAGAFGDADEHRRMSERLESLSEQAADIYAARCGQDRDEILELMAAETWFTPEEAVEYGFADEVIEAKPASTAPMMSVDLGRYGYTNIPPSLMAASDSSRGSVEPHGGITSRGEPRQPERTTTNMSLARIAMALGAPHEADEAAVLSAIDRLKSGSTLLAELRAITKQPTNEELTGAVRGLVEAAGQVPQLKAQIEGHVRQADDARRAQLLAADKSDPKGRKLTPAMEKLFADKPVSELEAFLKIAPHVVAAVGGKQPPTGDTSNPENDVAGAELKHNGKTWSQLKPYEKHNLFVDDKRLYDEMKAQHEQQRPAARA